MKINFKHNGTITKEIIERTISSKSIDACIELGIPPTSEMADFLGFDKKVINIAAPVEDEEGNTTGYRPTSAIVLYNCDKDEYEVVTSDKKRLLIEDTDVCFTSFEEAEIYSYLLNKRKEIIDGINETIKLLEKIDILIRQ